jgi:hypothetical protein
MKNKYFQTFLAKCCHCEDPTTLGSMKNTPRINIASEPSDEVNNLP